MILELSCSRCYRDLLTTVPHCEKYSGVTIDRFQAIRNLAYIRSPKFYTVRINPFRLFSPETRLYALRHQVML